MTPVSLMPQNNNFEKFQNDHGNLIWKKPYFDKMSRVSLGQ